MPRVARPKQPAPRWLARSTLRRARAHRARLRVAPSARPGVTSDRSVVVRAAAVLGLVWLGDALIYVVLPLHAPAFGISLALVGVVLSVNRVVRILGYGWVSTLGRRFGMRALTQSAAHGAAVAMTLSLLFAGTLSLGSALLSAGLILAFQHLMIVVMALVAGRLIDRVGPYRVLVPCIVVVVGGLFALAHGVLYPAAIVIVL